MKTCRRPATPSYTVRAFDCGLVQHRVEAGGLVAVTLAPAGAVLGNADWTITRPGKWTAADHSIETMRGFMWPGAATLRTVLRAVQHGRLAA